MSFINKIKTLIDEQKEKQFQREKEELARLEKDNVRAEEQYKIRVKLAKERAKKKKFSKNPLDQRPSELPTNESFFAKSKEKPDEYDSSEEFKPSSDYKSMVGSRYGKE